jgi:O-antigen ligase
MTTFFNVKDTLTNKISYYHLLLLMASLPFDMFYSHIILASYCLHTLIHLNKNAVKPLFNLRTIALQSVFLVTGLSTIYAVNKPEAFNEWGKQLTIFIFPLLFCLNPFEIKKYRPQLLMAFALVCTATIIYLYIDAFITIKHYKLPLATIFSGAFTNHNFAEPIDIHATFFSMQILLSLVYLVSIFINERRLYRKLLYLICCAILAAGIIQLSSKAIFISLVFIINVAVPWFLLKGPARVRFIMAAASFSAVVIGGILSSAVFKERFVTELKLDMTKPKADEIADSRLARWGVTAGYIEKKMLIGYGAGSEIGLLQDGFYSNKLYDSYLKGLNTHSEYLSITLKSGIIGLLIYLATLSFGFVISLRQKDILFFTFLTLLSVVSISENLLDVDKGIIFYAFFFTFFMFCNEGKKEIIGNEAEKAKVQRLEPEMLV